MLVKTKEDAQIIKISELFGIEEKLKDEKGDLLKKIEGGSEPDAKFSNLEKLSSYHESPCPRRFARCWVPARAGASLRLGMRRR